MTDDLRAVIEQARQEAARRHGNYLDVEHLMLGLLHARSGPAYEVLARAGVDQAGLYTQIAGAVGMERPTPAPVKDLSKWAKDALERTWQEAERLGQSTLNSGHLLLSLLGESEGAVHDALAATALTPEGVRGYLREHAPRESAASTFRPPAPGAARRQPSRRPAAPDGDEPEYTIIPFRPAKKQKSGAAQAQPSRWGNWPLILLGIGAFLAYLVLVLPGNALFTFVIVLIGWVFSLTLHEFSHALVAYLGGDYTVREKGYLSFNPLKYMHPMLSIGLPLLFLALGGIGLPGGAVYIERHRLKNKWWGAAVSAAGPAANLLLALLLAAPFFLGLVDLRSIVFGSEQGLTIWSAVAFLAMLQITAVVFNLLPVPPLDGFGIIEPFLDERTRFQLRQLGGYSLMLIFVALWFLDPVSNAFWNMIFDICRDLHVPPTLISEGLSNFMFWRQP
jgi:Zn-dependent protease